MVPRILTQKLWSLAAAASLMLPHAAIGQSVDPGILDHVEVVYAAISAHADETRDWPAFHAMFLPHARLISPRQRPDGVAVSNHSVPEWIVDRGLALDGRGFVEDVVHHRVEHYGPIAQVFTTWVTRTERGGPINNRGAATLQLVRTDDGWRVASWIWTGELDGEPLPRP